MKQHKEELTVPQNVNFQTQKFIITLNLQVRPQCTEVLKIQLHRKEQQEDILICEIDENQVRTNAHLSFFQRPSNLFTEMVAVQRDIKVTDFGQITFYVSLGRKSKFLITLNAVNRRRENQDIGNSQKQLLADLNTFNEIYDKYAQKLVGVLKKKIELKRLNEQIPIKRKYGYQLQFQKYLQGKQLKYCNDIREGILRTIKSEKQQ